MSSEILENGTSILRVEDVISSLTATSSSKDSPTLKLIYQNMRFERANQEKEDTPLNLTTYPQQSTAPSSSCSSGSSSSSLDNIIYQVPKSNECIYAQPKPIASVCVDDLIPEAAKLILAQIPKNRVDLADRERSNTDFSIYSNDYLDTDDNEPLIAAVDYDDNSYNRDDCLDEAPFVDYGLQLQVIHEETESQMESDSEHQQELERCAEFCTETIRQRKTKQSDSLSKLDLLPDYTSSWIQATGISSSPDSDIHDRIDHKTLPDEIIIKHIRVPSDWDPDVLLRRIYTILEPNINSTGICNDGMEGHMQILSGNRKKGTFWNAWKRKFCVARSGKLSCYERDDCQDLFQSINLIGGEVDFLDPVEFVGKEKGKTMVNRILGVDDGKGHYHVFQCSTTGEANRWIETLQEQTVCPKTFAIPSLSRNPSIFRDVLLVDFGTTNVRAGILTHQPTLPSLFFNSVMSENEETGRIIYGNAVYLPVNRKKAKIRFPFECTSKMCHNNIDLDALKGFMLKIFTDLKIMPHNYRLILTLPRRIDKKCRQSILHILFHDFKMRSVLMCHQSVISFWGHSAENGIVVDIGERCDVVPVSQGFVLSHAWGRTPLGGHVMKHSLRQGLGPQENGLYLSTPVENLVLRFISENFVCVTNGGGAGARKLSQDSQEIVIEMDLRDILPFSNLIGVNQDVLRGVAEGFFDPGLYGIDCESLQRTLYKSLQDCGVDTRKEMSKNIFLVGGCTLIPGFPERLEMELTKLCPPHLKPIIQVSPYRYHSSFIGASVLAGTEAYEKSLLQRIDYVDGPGPAHWLV